VRSSFPIATHRTEDNTLGIVACLFEARYHDNAVEDLTIAMTYNSLSTAESAYVPQSASLLPRQPQPPEQVR